MTHPNHLTRRTQDTAAALAFDARCEARAEARQAEAKLRGIRKCRCDECGETRSLNWLDAECNNSDGLSWECGGTYREVSAV